MAPLSLFALPPTTHPVQSSLFHNLKGFGSSHDGSVPPTEELEALLDELKRLKGPPEQLKVKVKEAKHNVEKGLHQVAERERGLKEEQQPALSPGSPDEALAQIHSFSKDRHRQGTPSSIGETSHKKHKSKDHKNKKRKREDEEGDSRSTPTPSASGSVFKAKVPSAPKIIHSTVQDFNLPPPEKLRPSTLLPEKPVPNPPLPPQPLRPEDVKEDFSKSKPPPNQTPINTFYTVIDPYLRPVREEDIGWLEYNGDEVDPFVMPRLGKHYLEVWAEQDSGIFHAPGHQEDASPPSAPNPSFDPSQISNEDLLTEEVGHGPLTERVISALLPVTEGQDMWASVKAAEDAMTGRPGGSGAAASRKEKALVGGKNGLEERLGGTLRYHEILDPNSPSVPDYSDATSDPIATALRQAQDELRHVMDENKERKKVIVERAKDMLAKQEYMDMRDQLDRSIIGLYTRQQKAHKKEKETSSQHGRERDKKKKKRVTDEDEEEEGKSGIPPCALGMGPDEDNNLVVSDQMMELVRLRRNWVDSVGGILARRETEMNGDVEMDDAGDDDDGSAMDVS